MVTDSDGFDVDNVHLVVVSHWFYVVLHPFLGQQSFYCTTSLANLLGLVQLYYVFIEALFYFLFSVQWHRDWYMLCIWCTSSSEMNMSWFG